MKYLSLLLLLMSGCCLHDRPIIPTDDALRQWQAIKGMSQRITRLEQQQMTDDVSSPQARYFCTFEQYAALRGEVERLGMAVGQLQATQTLDGAP